MGEKHDYPLRSANPFYERDYNKCILCGRCVTVCHEMQYCEAVDHSKRGFATKIAASFDHSMQETPCVFCGNCVSVCPVGALSEKAGRFQGREWESEESPDHLFLLRCGMHAGPEREGQPRASRSPPTGIWG